MKHPSYITGDPTTDCEINDLAKRYSQPHTREYIHQLFTTVIKLHLDKADEHDLYLANVTLKELRHIFRTFQRYRDKKKVVVFGSHRTPCNSKEYLLAEDFARQAVAQGWQVMTGGGGGVMEACNKGAGKDGFAVKIKLPLELEPNPYVIKGEKLINVHYFFTRKLTFIKESDATVLFPGGFGTHDEGFEVLTLLQTGKTIPRPIIMIETPGQTYWKNWLSFVKKQLQKGGYVRPADFSLFKIVSSAKAAMKEISNFYQNYHSIRYGKDISIIRLNHKLSEKALKKLSRQFKDIITGEIRPSGPLPVEVRNKEYLDLPRVCFKFDRQNFSRLIELIWALNKIS